MPDVTHADEPAQKKTWIYAIGVAASPKGPVKIGRTTQDVKYRLSRIQQDRGLVAPDDLDRKALSVLYAAVTEPWVEKRLHHHFRSYRICGEWFALNPAVVAREVRMAVLEILAGGPPEIFAKSKHQSRGESRALATSAAMRPSQHLKLFNGWVDAGFTEEQALRMVAMLAAGNV